MRFYNQEIRRRLLFHKLSLSLQKILVDHNHINAPELHGTLKLAHRPTSAPRLLGVHPALTGLRGMVMVLIFLFHCNVPGFSGAFVNLELFFALSGFLITALLLQEFKNHAAIDLKAFYIRRFLRLGPALLFFLVCYLLFCYNYYKDSETRIHQLQDVLIVLFYSANWTRAFGMQRPDVLGHCWSLSVEEQFYSIWPIMVVFLVRLSNRKRSLAIAMLFPLPWIWRIYLLTQGASWDRVYNGFDCRADSLLAGCLIASLWYSGVFSRWRHWRFLAPLLATIAIIALAVLTVYADWQSMALYNWQYAVISLAAVIIIVDVTNRPRGFLAHAMSFPIVFGIGTISYGLYLWHYPVIHFIGLTGYTGSAAVWLSAGVTIGFASLSWFVIERPALCLKKKYSV